MVKLLNNSLNNYLTKGEKEKLQKYFRIILIKRVNFIKIIIKNTGNATKVIQNITLIKYQHRGFASYVLEWKDNTPNIATSIKNKQCFYETPEKKLKLPQSSETLEEKHKRWENEINKRFNKHDK